VSFDLDTEDRFARAAQALLGAPLLDRSHDAWADIVIERDELRSFFDEMCGWALTVDPRGGFARLYKRRTPDATRPLVRSSGKPMTATGYALVMMCAAELITRPTTSLSDLAENLEVAATADSTLPRFDATVHAHRLAFVDAVRWLSDAALVTITAGNVDGFVDDSAEAVIVADPARFAQLLASATPPSRIEATDTDSWVAALSDEPRYRDTSQGVGDDRAVRRHARHMLARELLDDPALHHDDHTGHVAQYLASSTGRNRLVDAARRAGFTVEVGADCVVAVAPNRHGTDRLFGGVDIITQVAAVLLAQLCPDRVPSSLTVDACESTVAGLLADDPGWAASYQQPGGAALLTRSAIDTLIAFDLARRVEADGTPAVAATASAARFTISIADRRRADDTDAAPDSDPDPDPEGTS
jgi:uncharacterized protein (TIGR02678 family)